MTDIVERHIHACHACPQYVAEIERLRKLSSVAQHERDCMDAAKDHIATCEAEIERLRAQVERLLGSVSHCLELGFDEDGDVSIDGQTTNSLVSISVSPDGNAIFACHSVEEHVHGTAQLHPLVYKILKTIAPPDDVPAPTQGEAP